jgi:hypothetical protein
VGTRFSAPVQSGPGAHPASCTVGIGSLPGAKRPERGFGHRNVSFEHITTDIISHWVEKLATVIPSGSALAVSL